MADTQEHKAAPKHEASQPQEDAPKGKDEPLQDRIVQAVAGTHPTSKDVNVTEIHPAGAPGLYIARIEHTPPGRANTRPCAYL
jgi:hypothetical protein